jgi:CubicO group peptidase (beta-lactamase class C family)
MTGATACLLVLATSVSAFEPLPRAEPEARQMDPAALDAAFDAMGDLLHVRGMVVVRDGYVVGEQHWYGEAATLRDSRSVTKSVISLLVGIAIDHGFIGSIDEPMVDYLPDSLVPTDQAKHEIRIVHLLTQTSGFEWNEDEDVVGWLSADRPTREILDTPMAATPGTVFNYNTAATHLLSVVLTEATGMRTIEFADAYLFTPLNIGERSWIRADYWENGGAGLALRTEDAAKIGVMCIDGGMFNDQRVVSHYWVNRSQYPTVHGLGQFGPLVERHYGWLWWLDRGGEHHYNLAWGWGGQFVLCVPALKLVVAVHSPWNVSANTARQREAAVLDIIVNQIVPAATDRRVLTTTGTEVAELRGIDDALSDLLIDNELQGATAAIVKDGRLVHARGYTLDEPDVAPLEPTALFRVIGISKALSSIAVHQLVEQGVLDHETGVQAALELQPLPGEQTDPLLDEVTVDHLLTHTSGLYNEADGFRVNDLVSAATGNDSPPTAGEISSYIVGRPFAFAPESNWDYNVYGYIMLGMLAEQSTGRPYVELMLDSVFRPVGVSRARMAHTLVNELAPTEVLYRGLEGDPYRPPFEQAVAGTGWVMAAPDLARVLSVLFDDPEAGGLMTPATRQSMMAVPFQVNAFVGYGRGWIFESLLEEIGVRLGGFVNLDDDLTVYGHTGSGGGVTAIAVWRSDNTVIVILLNHDPVDIDIEFPRIDAWPEHDLWGTVGVSATPAAPVSTESWIPVVAHDDGVGGSEWRSDVGLLNRSPLANSVRLRHYASAGVVDLELDLEPGEQRAVADVVGDLGLSGSGPLRVVSSEALTVTSRTFNHAATGTFGQFLGGEAHSRGLRPGDTVVLMQLREDPSFRTNIGLTNGWKRTAEVEVALFDGSGDEVGRFTELVPPEQTVQLNRPFATRGGRQDVRSGYAVVTVLFGQHLFVYASVVDNVTGDPTTMPARVAPGDLEQWIAAAAHAAGASDSQWRTDVAVLNLSGAETTLDLSFIADDGQTARTAVTVGHGDQVLLEDVVDQLGVGGTGAVHIASFDPVLVGSRTYNAGDAGTFGQYLEGEALSSAAASGETRWLAQLQHNLAFRTNIGLLNTSQAEALVRVRLHDRNGTELAATDRTLAAGQRVQLNEPFEQLAGRTDIGAGYATVEVLSGSGILCYASVVDNNTNDPTTIPALW